VRKQLLKEEERKVRTAPNLEEIYAWNNRVKDLLQFSALSIGI